MPDPNLSKLYDHPTSQALDEATTAPTVSRAAPGSNLSIYDGAAQPSEPTPTEDIARAFYGDSFVAGTIDRRLAELFDVKGKNEEERDTLRSNLIAIGETGLPDGTVAMLVEQFVDGELAAARAEHPDARDVELSKQIDTSNEELREALRQQYGLKDGEALLERAARFCRSHRRLAQVLQSHGIGSKPEVVKAIVSHVFSSGWR